MTMTCCYCCCWWRWWYDRDRSHQTGEPQSSQQSDIRNDAGSRVMSVSKVTCGQTLEGEEEDRGQSNNDSALLSAGKENRAQHTCVMRPKSKRGRFACQVANATTHVLASRNKRFKRNSKRLVRRTVSCGRPALLAVYQGTLELRTERHSCFRRSDNQGERNNKPEVIAKRNSVS